MPPARACFPYVPAGCRLLAVILATILNPLPQLPLVPHLLLQLYSVGMASSLFWGVSFLLLYGITPWPRRTCVTFPAALRPRPPCRCAPMPPSAPRPC